MDEYLEVRSAGLPELVPLSDSTRITVGRDPDNSIELKEAAVSRLHAVLERYGATWCVRDLGSANGTYVNGQRIMDDHRLDRSHEISIGQSRLVFRGTGDAQPETTERASPPPDLTRRERAVLVALCRPLVSAQSFSQPASIRDMASELVVSEAAIKLHLANLYDKFDIAGGEGHRRVVLANDALRRRAVSLSDLSADPS